MNRLTARKQQLEIRQLELESELKNGWENIQSTVTDGSFIKETAKDFFVNKIFKSQNPGGLLLAGSALLAVGVMRTKAPKILAIAPPVISIIGKGIKNLFNKKNKRIEIIEPISIEENPTIF